MRLVNMSNNVKVTSSALLIPMVCLNSDLDASYEIAEIPLSGFLDSDFTDNNGVTSLKANFEPRVVASMLELRKTRYTGRKRLLFIHSFMVIEESQFGSFSDSVVPKSVFKFLSGNPDIGYFYEMFFVLYPNITYDILYFSEKLGKVTQYFMKWDLQKGCVEVNYKVL